LVAARRWIDLLDRSSFDQARTLIRTDSSFTDLSVTQYAAALDWLSAIRLIETGPHGWQLRTEFAGLAEQQRLQLALERVLTEASLDWLQDADVLVAAPSDLPSDLADAANALGVSEQDAFVAVRSVFGRVDLEGRARLGRTGEEQLIVELERLRPGSTRHVALTSDGFGYDVSFECDGEIWHFEVKTTARRGRLSLYLSRHEYEVGRADPSWRLVVVALNELDEIRCVACVEATSIHLRAPEDAAEGGRWESARLDFTPDDLTAGLGVVSARPHEASSVVVRGWIDTPTEFAWMPPANPLPYGN
jgi:hypothetical protein